jgi:hypothetical protein
VKTKTDRSQNHQDEIAATLGQLLLHRVVAGAVEREEVEVGGNLVVYEQDNLAKYPDVVHSFRFSRAFVITRIVVNSRYRGAVSLIRDEAGNLGREVYFFEL